MSAVIDFPVDRITARKVTSRIHKAEVLLFTGVQVERRDVTPPDAMKPARPATAMAAADPS